MSTRKKFEEEIAKLEKVAADALAGIETWKKALKLLPKDTDTRPKLRRAELRPGSDMDLARIALTEAQKPLHINQLIVAMGRESSKESKISIASSIQAYARREIIFKKTAPNTFGLIDMPQQAEDGSDLA